LAGEACSTKDVQIKIRLVAPPQYVMTTTSTDKVAAIDVMEKAVEKIGEVIIEEKGDMTVKMAVGLFTKVVCGDPADNCSQRSFPRRMMPSSRL
jgi:translation initiation factor 2 alpha subunit (eIF-2alpha)